MENIQAVAAGVREKLAAPGLSLHDYHDVRKKIRDFRDLYALINQKSPNPVYENSIKELSELSTAMGFVKDKGQMAGSVRSFLRLPAKENYQIAPDFRKKIEALLQQLPPE